MTEIIRSHKLNCFPSSDFEYHSCSKELKTMRSPNSISMKNHLGKHSRAPWTQRSWVVISNLLSKTWDSKAMFTPPFILHFRMTRTWHHQGPTSTKRLCDWQENIKKGGDPLFLSLGKTLAEILELKSFSYFDQLTLQVNTFLVQWLSHTIIVEKYYFTVAFSSAQLWCTCSLSKPCH